MLKSSHWIHAAILVGLVYFLVGKLFSLPTYHVHAWRLAAWACSGVAFAAHIAYEHVRLRSRPLALAWHTAVAVALGALGLAVAGALHAFWTSSSIQALWLLAFIVWPIATAVPAFLVAFVTASALGRVYS